MSNLLPWREVVQPHPDVQSGRYQQAEFAADLSQVRAGNATSEYQDAAEFFQRTYLTAGIRRLLIAAIKRLRGEGEAPVVQLKTAFGGGKTHTMLALYHLLHSPEQSASVPAVAELIKEAGGMPPAARVAVIVGTSFSPNEPSQTLAQYHTEVHTLWGEIAAQLDGVAGYKLVAQSDAAATFAAADVLRALLKQAGPSVILIDELIAFMRGLPGSARAGSAGSFGSNLSFIQALTEAVRTSPTAMLIASIPESEEELGGQEGRIALNRVEKVFGRIEDVWQPVEVRESFEVVRRRLFGPIANPTARDATVAAFSEIYRSNANDFPDKLGEQEYEERMRSSYPIHPEVFDRLYEDWATLEKFQRTRGVLRLLAKVIHLLWQSDDRSLMLLPANIAVEHSDVRGELLRYIGEQWNSVIDADIKGGSAEIDRQSPRLGRIHAAERAARTILFGSAPGTQTSNHPSERKKRGIDTARVKLGVVQPNEEGGIAVYADALQQMGSKLAYLYGTEAGSYWFDVQPNLNRTVADRSSRVKDEVALAEMVQRIKRWPTRDSNFAGVHLAPADSGEVPDEERARLVVLSPAWRYSREATEDDSSDATAATKDILEHRGGSPRHYKNMLIFLAADASDYRALREEAGRYLAWKSICDDSLALNLDQAQVKQANDARDQSSSKLDSQLEEAYKWVIFPTQEGAAPIEWEAKKLSGFSGTAVRRAFSMVERDGLLISKWSAVGLNREFDQYLWRESEREQRPNISVKTLWQQLATYVYLPRLKSPEVLVEVIRSGAAAQDFFGYAMGYESSTDKYKGLSFGRLPSSVVIDDYSVLVDPEVARRLTAPASVPAAGSAGAGSNGNGGVVQPVAGSSIAVGSGTNLSIHEQPAAYPAPATPTTPPKPTHFSGRVELNSLLLGSSAGRIAEEILQRLPGTKISVHLDIEAELPEGADEQTQRTVMENASVLKFKDAEFS